MRKVRARVESTKKVSDFTVVLRLIDHLRQPTDKESSPFVIIICHIIEMIQCPDRTLFDTLTGGSTTAAVGVTGLRVPVTPSLEGVLVLAVKATTELFLGLAWSNLDISTVDLSIQRG